MAHQVNTTSTPAFDQCPRLPSECMPGTGRGRERARLQRENGHSSRYSKGPTRGRHSELFAGMCIIRSGPSVRSKPSTWCSGKVRKRWSAPSTRKPLEKLDGSGVKTSYWIRCKHHFPADNQFSCPPRPMGFHMTVLQSAKLTSDIKRSCRGPFNKSSKEVFLHSRSTLGE